jgi:hypothetical protein
MVDVDFSLHSFHFAIFGFLLFNAHFMHFVLSAFHCILFDNQLLFFKGYTSILVHFNFTHCYEHLLSLNLLFIVFSFIFYFNSFVV